MDWKPTIHPESRILPAGTLLPLRFSGQRQGDLSLCVRTEGPGFPLTGFSRAQPSLPQAVSPGLPRRRAPLLAARVLHEAPPLRRRRPLIGLFEMRRAGAHLSLQRRQRVLLKPSLDPRGRCLQPSVPASSARVGVRRPERVSG